MNNKKIWTTKLHMCKVCFTPTTVHNIMDIQDYTNKAQALLQDTNTYKVLNKDPTTRLKNKLIQTLKDIKQSGGLSDQKYKKP